MVWELVDGSIDPNKYIDILENNLWPVITRHFPANNYVFQDDNAPVHRARTIVEYKLRNKIKTLSVADVAGTVTRSECN